MEYKTFGTFASSFQIVRLIGLEHAKTYASSMQIDVFLPFAKKQIAIHVVFLLRANFDMAFRLTYNYIKH